MWCQGAHKKPFQPLTHIKPTIQLLLILFPKAEKQLKFYFDGMIQAKTEGWLKSKDSTKKKGNSQDATQLGVADSTPCYQTKMLLNMANVIVRGNNSTPRARQTCKYF